MMRHQTSTTSRARRYVPLLFLCTAALLGACEDFNAFNPPGADSDGNPVIKTFTIDPVRVDEGDVIDIRVEATGERSLTQINIDFSGAFSKDTVISLADVGKAVTRDIVLAVPQGTGPDSVLNVQVAVLDAAGESSPVIDTSLVVLDATVPTVTAEITPTAAVGSGEEITIKATASDNRGLARVGFQVTSGNGWDTLFVEEMATPQVTFSKTFILEAPDIEITTLQVRTFAVDINGFEGDAGESTAVELTDKTGPIISSLLVQGSATTVTVALRDSIRVEAAVADPSGIKRVAFYGNAVVGDPETFQDQLVPRFDRQTIEFPRPLADTLPRDTIVKGRIGSEDVTTKGTVLIYAEVEDGFGNISTATFTITVGGPLVQITKPTAEESPVNAPLNQALPFTVKIYDPAGVDSARLEFTGASTFNAPITLPANTTDTFTVTTNVTMPTEGGTITAVSRAWSKEGVVGVSGTRQIKVQDLTGPALAQIRVNDSNVSGGPTVPLGDSIKAEVDLSDNSGVKKVTFKGLALVGDSVLFEDEVVVRFDERSVTFPRAFEDTLPKSTTVRLRLGSKDVTTKGDVRLVVTAEDSLGNTSEGTFDFAVGGPSVVITAPSDNADTAAMADAYEVTVRIVDPSGIDSARLVVTGIISTTLPVALPAVTTDTFSVTTVLSVPAKEGSFTVLARAWNAGDVIGESDPRTITVRDQQGPDITSLLVQNSAVASTVPLGDSVLVQADVVDPSGIKKVTFVGQAVIGDTVLFNDTLITRFDPQVIEFPRPFSTTLPNDTTVRRRLGTKDDSTAAPVRIFVVAEDGLGNTSEATFDLFVGGPAVRITSPKEGVITERLVGDSMYVKISVFDSNGVDSSKLVLTGAMDTTYVLSGLPPKKDTVHATVGILLPDTLGTIIMQAYGWNSQQIEGSSGERVVHTATEAPADTERPVVTVAANPAWSGAKRPRLEFTDTLRIIMSASDEGSGLERMGLTVDVIRPGISSDTLQLQTTFASAVSGKEEQFEFVVPLDSIYRIIGITSATAPADSNRAALDAITPDTIKFEIHAFAVDIEGKVACSTGTEQTLACQPMADTATAFFRADGSPLKTELVAVRGRTRFLDNRAAVIADLAVDTVNERVFMSNFTQNLVEVLDLDADPRMLELLAPRQVGSQPWGVFIGDRLASANDLAFITSTGINVGDKVPTLIVGNSGGTNFSLVHLDSIADNIEEVDVIRLGTPNSVLFEMEEFTDDFNNASYSSKVFFDFSDRPQYLAQDSLLRIVYSTVSTEAAERNTVRYVVTDPDKTSTTDIPESRFFLNEEMVDAAADLRRVVGNVANLEITAYPGTSDTVEVFTYAPGYPGDPAQLLRSGRFPTVVQAVDGLNAKIDSVMALRGQLAEAPLFYGFTMEGAWDFVDLDMSDTTYVTASGDRGKIAVGEGAEAPTGRIFIWHGEQTPFFSTESQFLDLVNNASERVLGLGLNYNGSLGVARGLEATYFFTPDLRLQGLYEQSAQGGAGAVFHQDHNQVADGGHQTTDNAGAAFTGTPNHSIEVVNTFHFNQTTELFIRDNIAGPLKAGPPLDTDNGGFGRACPNAVVLDAADCVVAKLYGITDVGGVLVINVRTRDLTQAP